MRSSWDFDLYENIMDFDVDQTINHLEETFGDMTFDEVNKEIQMISFNVRNNYQEPCITTEEKRSVKDFIEMLSQRDYSGLKWFLKNENNKIAKITLDTIKCYMSEDFTYAIPI